MTIHKTNIFKTVLVYYNFHDSKMLWQSFYFYPHYSNLKTGHCIIIAHMTGCHTFGAMPSQLTAAAAVLPLELFQTQHYVMHFKFRHLNRYFQSFVIASFIFHKMITVLLFIFHNDCFCKNYIFQERAVCKGETMVCLQVTHRASIQIFSVVCMCLNATTI